MLRMIKDGKKLKVWVGKKLEAYKKSQAEKKKQRLEERTTYDKAYKKGRVSALTKKAKLDAEFEIFKGKKSVGGKLVSGLVEGVKGFSKAYKYGQDVFSGVNQANMPINLQTSKKANILKMEKKKPKRKVVYY